MLELLKVIVQAVVLERDDDGNTVGERLTESVALYTDEQMAEFVSTVKGEIAAQNNGLEPP